MDTSEHINTLGIQNSAAVLLPAGTVCLSRTASVGFVTIMGRPMTTSQDFVNWVCGANLDLHFLMYLLLANRTPIRELGSGAVHHTVYFPTVESFSVCVPAVSEQRRIAAALAEQLAAAAPAIRAAAARLVAAKALVTAYLRSAFESPDHEWVAVLLGDVCEFLPSKSISTKGDTEVTAITTGCLSETGFVATGLKPARMRAADVPYCLVKAGEVLVARSNTPELVGRASIYRGAPDNVVASDLTIRLWPRTRIGGEYIAAFLSYLYQTGHWRHRAGGASGTMKKITRAQLLSQQLKVPSNVSVTNSIVTDLLPRLEGADALVRRCREELSQLELLPATLLRTAFSAGT